MSLNTKIHGAYRNVSDICTPGVSFINGGNNRCLPKSRREQETFFNRQALDRSSDPPGYTSSLNQIKVCCLASDEKNEITVVD